jgi:hypothetical protein
VLPVTNIVTTLLDFILDLLRDPAKAQEFNDDPHAALASAGLTGVTADDVNAVLPMVADCSPVRDWQASYAPSHSGGSPWHGGSSGHHDSDVEAGHRPPHRPDHDEDDDDHGRGHHGGDHGGDHDGPEHHGQEFAVIQHLQYIQNSYSYSETNIHLEDSIWAEDGSTVFFGDDNVLNSGGGVVLSDVDTHGGDVDVDNEQTTVTDSYNHAEDGGVIGNGNEVDNSTTDNSTHDSHDVDFENKGDAAYAGDDQANGNTVVNDSYNPTSISDSGNVGSIVDSDDSHLGDTEIDDHTSYDNDEYKYTDNSINDSLNTDNSIDDSFNTEDSNNSDFSVNDSNNTDNSVNDSGNGNDVLSNNDVLSHNDVSDNAIAVDESAAATDPDFIDA